MRENQERYDQIATDLLTDGVRASQMFGMPTLKTEKGKAFAGLTREGATVFKLSGGDHASALALIGAELFDPGMGRPMREWVVVPPDHQDQWSPLARAALRYVAG
jgi:hypothetical protein